MKKTLPLYALLILSIAICMASCHENEIDSSEFDERFLTVSSMEELESLSSHLQSQDTTYIKNWQAEQKFTSLKSIYETVNKEEEIFLKNVLVEYSDDSTATRADFGYSEYAQKFLNRGSIVIDQFELVDMNVTNPKYSFLVNVDGIIKVGRKIYQFKKDTIKVIQDGDAGKIMMLKNIHHTNETLKIEVHVNVRSSNPISDSNSRTQANTSCESIIGSYRMIAYEEFMMGPKTDGCSLLFSYWIRMRSLKKFLGTWQNHNTGEMRIKVNKLTLNFFSFPDPDGDCWYPDNRSDWRTIKSWNEDYLEHTLPYNHTSEWYFIQEYQFSCRSYLEVPIGWSSALIMDASFIFAKGKNGTNCGYLGTGYSTRKIVNGSCH